MVDQRKSVPLSERKKTVLDVRIRKRYCFNYRSKRFSTNYCALRPPNVCNKYIYVYVKMCSLNIVSFDVNFHLNSGIGRPAGHLWIMGCAKKKSKQLRFCGDPLHINTVFSPFFGFFFFVKRIIHKNVNSAPDAIFFFFPRQKTPFYPMHNNKV